MMPYLSSSKESESVICANAAFTSRVFLTIAEKARLSAAAKITAIALSFLFHNLASLIR
jgi:hypothetical protein